MLRKLALTLLLLAAAFPLLAQDATPEPTPDATLEAPADGTPEGTPEPFAGFLPGPYYIGVEVNDMLRNTGLYIPQGYTSDGDPLPLLLVFHGAGGSPQMIMDASGFNALADQEGFIVAYLEGMFAAWNDGRPDMRLAAVDDVGFVQALLNFLRNQTLNYDAARVYAAGYSMGGMFSFRLGCQLPGRIAAIASVAGLMPEYLLPTCNSASPLPVLLVQGTEDEVLRWSGIPSEGQGYLSAFGTTDFWAQRNACEGRSTTVHPDTLPDDGTILIETNYLNCVEGTQVQLLALFGGGHTWPGGGLMGVGVLSQELDASAAIWAFLSQHRQPE